MSDIIILPELRHCFVLTTREAGEEINKNFMANLNKNEKVVNELTSVNKKISYFNCKLDLFLVMMIAI